MKRSLAVTALVGALTAPGFALAQSDAGAVVAADAAAQPATADAGATTAAEPAVDATDEPDPISLANEIYSRVRSGEWLPALAAVLMLLVWLARRFMANVLAIDWFNTKAGGYTLSLTLALAVAFSTSLAAGEFSVGILFAALGSAWAAAGGYDTLRDVIKK